MPATVWVLGCVSLLMDLSSEIYHALLPLFLTVTLGLPVAAVGAIDGIAEATASITKLVSGRLSDRSRRRKPLILLGYGLAAGSKLLFPIANGALPVLGARFADRGDYSVSGPRKWAMQLLAKVISGLAKTRLTDVTSGFRAANGRAINQYLDHYPAEYLGDTIDSLVVAIRSGCRVTQVPVEMRPRQGGTPSHNPVKSAVYLGRSVFALMFALTRKRSTISDPALAPKGAV